MTSPGPLIPLEQAVAQQRRERDRPDRPGDQRRERRTNVQRLNMLEPISWDGLARPERQWMVDGLVPMFNVTLLSGDGGLGKSLATQQLLTSAALGKPWFGRPTRKVRAIGIFCEDDKDELHRRQHDICRRMGVRLGDMEDLQLLSRVGHDNSMMEFERWEGKPGAPTDFYFQLLETIKHFGAQLIVLDSLHDLFSGNENSRHQARQFVGMLRGMAMTSGGALVLNSHPSAAGLNTGSGTSGSTAWNNTVRSRLYMTREGSNGDDDGDRDRRVLKGMKANYGPTGGKIRLLWEDGIFVTEGGDTPLLQGLKNDACERVFLNLIGAVDKEGRPVSASRNAGNFAARVFSLHADRQGYSRKDFEKAMERLFADGKIQQVSYGRPGDNRKRIEIVQEAK